MNKKKFSVLASELKELTSDFYFVETNDVKNFTAKMIVAKATELIAAANEGEENPPVKSEMPCNCHSSEQAKNLNKFIHDAVESVRKQDDLAAIMIVPVSALLAAAGDMPLEA